MGTSDIQSVSSWQRRVMEQRRVREIGRGQLCSSANPLKPPNLLCLHPNLSVQWKAISPHFTDKISPESIRWCHSTPTSLDRCLSGLPFILTSLFLILFVTSNHARVSLDPRHNREESWGRNLTEGASHIFKYYNTSHDVL